MTSGGKREGAGRPATGVIPTVVVRVNAELVPIIKAIKDSHKQGSMDYVSEFHKLVADMDNLGNRLPVTSIQSALVETDLQNKVDSLLAALEIRTIERDKVTQELSHLRPEASRQSETIAEQKQELKQLRAKLNRLNDPVLGDGRYDGSIPLSVAMVHSKVSAKQAAELTKEAKVVFNIAIGEKLTKDQNMKLYNWIMDEV